MSRLLLILALAALPLAAQDKPAGPPTPQPEYVQRVVEVQHQKVNEIANLLGGSGVTMRPNEHFRAISLYGPKELVEATVAEIKRLDKPVMQTSRNVELVAYLILASPKGTAGDAVPSDLEPVVKQLQSIFGLRDFRLFETALIRVREGSAIETSGSAQMPASDADLPTSLYQIRCTSTAISAAGAQRTVRLDNFRLNIRVPYRTGGSGVFNYADLGFNTHLDVREGQKVVVGQSKVGQGDSALVLVLTARVAE